MTVKVRLFAGLREAAGAETVASEATTVRDVVADLDARFGDRFAARRRISKIVVDGETVDADDESRTLDDRTEMVLLPPFSGG